MAPFTPGEATLSLVLLDDQVDPPVTNGRWLFPPGWPSSMAEEHGMFDGFSLGQPPEPGRRAVRATRPPTATSSTTDLSNLGDVTTVAGRLQPPL